MSSEFEEINSRFIGKYIWLSFIAAFLLAAIPLPYQYFFWLPDWVVLTVFFWILNRPMSVGLGVAFVVGLFMDFLTSSLLGSHALAYILASFFIIKVQKRASMFTYGGQALTIFVALLYTQLVLSFVVLATRWKFTGFLFFVSPFTGALIWPLLNKLMLKILFIFRRSH